MKKILNGKCYDTKTATYLFKTYEDVGREGLLYRKKNGEFFLAHYTQWDGESDQIEPISVDDAKEMVGLHDGDLYVTLFGDVEE